MRAEVYGPVHKGLRANLFDLALVLGRSDFEEPSDLRAAVAAYRRSVGFLREHHHNEATYCESVLAPRAKALVADNTAQHEELDATLEEMDSLASTLEQASEGQRAAAGGGLHERYRDFLGRYLLHMDHEETVMQAAFWAHCTDEEIFGMHGRAQASLAPARFLEWLAMMLPAMNVQERALMLGGIKRNAPAPAFAAASEVATRVLGSAGLQAATARAERMMGGAR